MMATTLLSSGVLVNMKLERTGAEFQWHCMSPDKLHYTEIEKKVADVFPASHGRMLELTWLDSDGDLVTFSSDEELQQVFETRNSSVQLVIRDSEVSAGSSPMSHSGCQSSGFCTCKDDKDTCEHCEWSAMDSSHPTNRQTCYQPSPNSAPTEMLQQFWQWMQPVHPTKPDDEKGPPFGARTDQSTDSGSQERKRTWQDMTEQCVRQMQEMDIKRNVREETEKGRKSRSDGSDDAMSEDESEGVWEDLMEDWLRENWSAGERGGDESSGEAAWQHIMKKLYNYLSGANEPVESTENDPDTASQHL